MHGIHNELLAEHALNLHPMSHLQALSGAEHAEQPALRPAVVGSLILDGNGTIRFCSNALANLVGVGAGELVGRTIKSLLPEMPLSPTTPGYNVAFAAFSCAAGYLHKWVLVRNDGSKLEVEASISSLKTGKEYLFCLGLHCPSLPSMELNELHRIAPLMQAEPAKKTKAPKPAKLRASAGLNDAPLHGQAPLFRSEPNFS